MGNILNIGVICVQVTGRELFQFRPEMVEEDDEADIVSYQREIEDDVSSS